MLPTRRISTLVALLGLAALAAPFTGTAMATAATAGEASTLTPTTATTNALVSAYAAARHVPAGAVGGVRGGSEHIITTADGTRWAVADFQPSRGANSQLKAAFQDGAGRALFTSTDTGTGTGTGTDWRLVPTETQMACTSSVPVSVKTALGLIPAGAKAEACDTAARPSAAAKASVAAKHDLGSTISSIALGQVGVATNPAETSFSGVDCDPYSTLDAAFSPNADGCGPDAAHQVENQNEAWCSDFAKWVWAQAGITVDMNTLNAGADSFYTWATDQGETPVADSGTPEPGDAVLFYGAGTITASTYADHVGLVTSVNADGTVNMVNGDFLGSSGITVEYDQNLDLTPWAASVWGTGEQWVLVTPPTAAQNPAPTASVAAPTSAVAGTTVNFTASANEAGGSISQYSWTFGDGRDNNTTGQQVSHVFQRAGLYTVTMSATSNFGTVTTKTWNIDVSAPSSAISSVPNNSVWYTTDPVMQYEFTANSSGGLAVDSYDGASWLQQTEPGTVAGGSAITGLTYSDGDAGYATVPHAYYRTSAGSLGTTYQGTNGWTSATLPGAPAATSSIEALAAVTKSSNLNVTPSVFFFDGSGNLNVSTESSGGTWSTAALQLPATSSPGSLATAVCGSDEYAFYLDHAGDIVAASNGGGGAWLSLPIHNTLGIQPGTPLSAATTNTGIDVFFIDAAGNPAAAHESAPGSWSVREIPGVPATSSTLTATSDLSAAGAVGDEVFYLTSSGAPGVTTWDGSAWNASTLPGTAASIQGAGSNVIPGASEELFVSGVADGSSQLGVETATAPGSAWTYSALPSTPTAYPGTVLLYAADPGDDATALAAASYAGLPASSQVTTNFARAWAATLSGNYLVIAVGQAAVNALYDNPCGWANPSADDPGSTPFGNVERPLNVTLTNLFIVALASNSAQETAAADDIAYYAVNGALPTGATLPTLAYPGHTCLGSST